MTTLLRTELCHCGCGRTNIGPSGYASGDDSKHLWRTLEAVTGTKKTAEVVRVLLQMDESLKAVTKALGLG